MEFQSHEELLRAGRDLWGDGLEPTDENLHAAAVGLASSWFRNTEAVEDHSHVNGPWRDADMLRHNAWATHLCLLALRQLAGGDRKETQQVLEELLRDVASTLPSDQARRSLRRERVNAPAMAARWVESNGLGNWLAFLTTPLLYPAHWWGTPGYDQIVDDLCRQDTEPPEPETFRDRMLREPWALSDEQAQFVCDHRYDVGRG